MANLGPTPAHRWTFISYRQKVSRILVLIFHLTNFHMRHLYQSKSNILTYFLLPFVQGLVPSLQRVCPIVEHCTCVRHLYANLRTNGHQGILLKDILWTITSSHTQNKFPLFDRGVEEC